MTTPNPYVDGRGWPVVDRLLVAAFTELVTLDDVAVWWGTALPENAVFPAGRVIRLPGGGINPEGYEDLHRIEVTTFGRTRPESDTLTAGVRQTMADLDGEEWAAVGIDRCREESGPGRVPDINEDVRAVPTTWGVVVRRQPQ